MYHAEMKPRRKGGTIVRSFRNRLGTIQSLKSCGKTLVTEGSSRKREPANDHPYMRATAWMDARS